VADQPAATGVAGVTGGGGALLGPARIQILRSPGCPLAGRLRGLVEWCVARSGVSATVEEIEGPYPSPTLLINGADVSGRRAEVAPSCRLDVPGAGQILAALQIRDGGGLMRAAGIWPGVPTSWDPSGRHRTVRWAFRWHDTGR
jgi:hypothetical protein